MTEIARLRLVRAARCTSGRGDWRKARNCWAADSTSTRVGATAGTSRPASMPAIDACRPDSSVANHSTTTRTTYGDARHSPSRASTAMPTRQAAAITSGVMRSSSE